MKRNQIQSEALEEKTRVILWILTNLWVDSSTKSELYRSPHYTDILTFSNCLNIVEGEEKGNKRISLPNFISLSIPMKLKNRGYSKNFHCNGQENSDFPFLLSSSLISLWISSLELIWLQIRVQSCSIYSVWILLLWFNIEIWNNIKISLLIWVQSPHYNTRKITNTFSMVLDLLLLFDIFIFDAHSRLWWMLAHLWSNKIRVVRVSECTHA